MADTIQNNLDTKCGIIAQSCNEGLPKGCNICNENHPEYEESTGIRTSGDLHYIRMEVCDVCDEWDDNEGSMWYYADVNTNFCFNCGRNLNLPYDKNAWSK